MSTRNTPSRIRRLVATGAVVAAGAVSGVIGVSALADANPSTPTLDDDEYRAIAEVARTNRLTGLSPASLTPHPSQFASRAAELAAIAEFARTNGLTGLSPASMGPIEPAAK
jgi:hypothetical protein